MPETSPRPRIVPIASGKTDVGRQREHNEDHFAVRPELGLFVVCDGMGGNNAGEVASALATTSLQNFFQATVEGDVPGKPRKEDETLTESEKRLVFGVRKANSDVYEISSTRIEHQGMGSTIVAMHVSNAAGSIEIAHIGDSRCYRVRDGKIEQLTRDHSLIGDALAWNPNLTEEELSRLPKNIISRALGLKRYVEVDVKTETALPGDIYLLCSDGLSGMVKDRQILELILLMDDLDEACDGLIALANEAGGNDNITAVAVRIEGDPNGELAVPEDRPAASPQTTTEAPDPPDDDEAKEPEIQVPAASNERKPSPAKALSPTPATSKAAAKASSIAHATAVAVDSGPATAPEISVAALADVDELLSYLDGAPESDVGSNGSNARCAECGGVPVAGDAFCGHCGARIAP